MMKLYGHPWSISTRKVLTTLAEKQHEIELVLIMIPKGEQKHPDHVARHPFGKVPVLEDDTFTLYETRAIARYLDGRLEGTRLIPEEPHAAARMEQWISAADAYFIPHANPLVIEGLFRKYLGGTQNVAAMKAGREGMLPALDVMDRWLASNEYLAGRTFSLADIHWMPYVEYLFAIGEGEPFTRRKHVAAWWSRVSGRPSWQKVARSGPQPYDADMRAEVIEERYRGSSAQQASRL